MPQSEHRKTTMQNVHWFTTYGQSGLQNSKKALFQGLDGTLPTPRDSPGAGTRLTKNVTFCLSLGHNQATRPIDRPVSPLYHRPPHPFPKTITSYKESASWPVPARPAAPPRRRKPSPSRPQGRTRKPPSAFTTTARTTCPSSIPATRSTRSRSGPDTNSSTCTRSRLRCASMTPAWATRPCSPPACAICTSASRPCRSSSLRKRSAWKTCASASTRWSTASANIPPPCSC